MSYESRSCRVAAALIAATGATAVHGQSDAPVTALPEVTVGAPPGPVQRYQLPGTTENVTRSQIDDTINAVNTEDALKYLPGLIVRKRNYGDQQAPLATRTSGLGQSARSLIYADGVLLSALIGNNNTSASPRWALVSPTEIERIDVMYGPFSAQYAGNSMGAVVDITTRMPKAFEASAVATATAQDYSLYGTSQTYASSQYGMQLGNRYNGLSWRLTGNYLDSRTQPLNMVTALTPAAPSGAGTRVTGAYVDQNRLGQPIVVIGSGGIEHKHQDTLKFKAAYDITPEWQASYTYGYFQNIANSNVETYLRNAAGNPVFSGSVNINGYNYVIPASAFSGTNGYYKLNQSQTAQSVALKSDMGRTWDWEAVYSQVVFDLDAFRSPAAALPTGFNAGAGSIQALNGTGWSNADVKGIWRPQGADGAHQVSFGAHADRYKLVSTTSTTANWGAGDPLATTQLAVGRTSTTALWMQDAWRVTDGSKLTLGLRGEHWRAYDGQNFSAAPASNVYQSNLSATRFSPKASFAWRPAQNWRATASYGTAYRFPTVTELYQAVTVAGVVYTPNPNLAPERAYSGELALERVLERGRVRLSLFQESLHDALIAQNSTIPGTNVIGSSVQNIDSVRSRGFELAAELNDVYKKGLDFSGSMTFVDSKILSDPNFRNAAGVLTNVSGNYTPNIPRFKATAVATYRYDEHWTGTLAARYSARVWATIDNTDIHPNTYQGFYHYFVVDARVRYQIRKNWSAALGVDNINNEKYFLFHPFPQRTAVAELKFEM